MCACVQSVKTEVMQIWILALPSRIMLSSQPCLFVIRALHVWDAWQAFVLNDTLNRCMQAVKPPKRDGGRFRKRNDQLMDSSPKERLQFAQVTLTGLQLVLQELVSSQQPHLIPNLTDEQIDFQIKSWLHRCSSAWTQISTITRDLKIIAQKERMRLAMWEQLQSRVQKMRAEFNMQRTHVALLEVNRRKNLEKEEAAQQKKKELAEAIAFQKEAAKSKEGRRALSKLSHTTVRFRFMCLVANLRVNYFSHKRRLPVLKTYSARMTVWKSMLSMKTTTKNLMNKMRSTKRKNANPKNLQMK